MELTTLAHNEIALKRYILYFYSCSKSHLKMQRPKRLQKIDPCAHQNTAHQEHLYQDRRSLPHMHVQRIKIKPHSSLVRAK